MLGAPFRPGTFPGPGRVHRLTVPVPVATVLSALLRSSEVGILALPEIRVPYLPCRPLVLQVVPVVLSLPTCPVVPLVLDSRELPNRRSLLVVPSPLPVCRLYPCERVCRLLNPVP